MINLADNPSIAGKVDTVIYNMAFAPKIRSIDLSGLRSFNADAAEALIKLLKISGAIEFLNLRHTLVENYLDKSEEFFVALGSNKTLKYLNMDRDESSKRSLNSNMLQTLAKSVAMNAYRLGQLEALSI